MQATREWIETNIAFSTEHGFAFWATWESILRGWTLVEQGQAEEAREWTRRILNKKATLPGYLKRKERPWFRKAAALLKQVQAVPARAAGS